MLQLPMWKIEYYNNEVEENILKLPDSLLARYFRLTKIMQTSGPNIGEPHTKALGEGLFELRLKGKEGIARVFFCTMTGKQIYMLHSIIKKTQKIPAKEIILARKRLSEVKHGKTFS